MKFEKMNNIDLSKESYLHKIIFNAEARRDDLESDKLL